MVLLSLCIPTNGIAEWVFPVLDSIFSQNVDENLYEVVVTDNGHNDDFKQKMKIYTAERKNLIYKETGAFLFENQIYALRLAHGEYLKFLNHRALLLKGSLRKLIDIVSKNLEKKPVMYFSNGVLKFKGEKYLETFDSFVYELGEYASWTTGVGVWKEDFNKIPENHVYNKISPHSDVLFNERNKHSYLIFNEPFCEEIKTDHSKKGKYDLFKAFAVEEPSITLGLYIDGSITAKTFKHVKQCYKKFVASLYFDFYILKRPCSYILTGFDDAMGIFFTKKEIKTSLVGMLVQRSFRKMLKILKIA